MKYSRSLVKKVSLLNVVFVLFVFALFANTSAQENYSKWSDSLRFILNTKSTGMVSGGLPLRSYPLLVRLNPSVFSGFSKTQKKGEDIRFANSKGKHLSYEIERWVTDTAEIWVRVDSIMGDTIQTPFTMYWGNSTAADSSKPDSVFLSGSNFQGVWHMNEPTDSIIKDATKNGFDGTPVGKKNGTNKPKDAPGVIGVGKYFNGGADNSPSKLDTCLYIMKTSANASNKLSFDTAAKYMISAWVNTDTLFLNPGNDRTIANKGDLQYSLQIGSRDTTKTVDPVKFPNFGYTDVAGSWRATFDTGRAKQWFFVAGVHNNNKQYLYVNGVCKDSVIKNYGTTGSPRVATDTFAIGGLAKGLMHCVKGSIDEVRFESTAHTVDWIRMSYLTQKVGANILTPEGIKITKDLSSTVAAIGDSNIVFSVNASGQGTLKYQWKKNGVNLTGDTLATKLIAKVAIGDTGSYTVVVSNSNSQATSSAAKLYVKPKITVQPLSSKIQENAKITVSATVAGSLILQYKWLVNGVVRTPPDTSPNIVLNGLIADAGTYQLIVSSSYGADTSKVATITVVAAIKAMLTVSDTVGGMPLTDTLTDASTGSIEKRYWIFGDGSVDSTTALSIKSVIHTYKTASTVTAKLKIWGVGGSLDSATRTIKVVDKSGNPIIMAGSYVSKDSSVSLVLSNVNELNTTLPPPLADSVFIWYRSGAVIDTSTKLSDLSVKKFSATAIKANGNTFTTVIKPGLAPTDTLCAFMSQVKWRDTTKTPFLSSNGVVVLLKDNVAPNNPCAITGKQLSTTDSIKIIISNLKLVDTTVVDSVGIWYGTIGSDTVPDFSNSTTTWLAGTSLLSIINGSGNDTIYIYNAKLKTTTQKTIMCAVAVRGINDVLSSVKKASITLGTLAPINPIILTVDTVTASRVLLSWNPVSVGTKVQVLYQANIPIDTGETNLDLSKLQTIEPGTVTDTFVLITGLSEKTKYYFGARISQSGSWSSVTALSLTNATTSEASISTIKNTIKIDSLWFDSTKNQVRIKYSAPFDSAVPLNIRITYGIDGYSTSANGMSIAVKSKVNDTIVDIKELVYDTSYYVSLWLAPEDGSWVPPTDSSKSLVKIPHFSWQPVKYGKFKDGDTVFAFNNNIKLMTGATTEPNTTDDIVQLVVDTTQQGFIPLSIAFSFKNPQQGAPFYVGLKYEPILAPYTVLNARMYRFDVVNKIWTPEKFDTTTIIDSVNGYFSVKTRELDAPFRMMIDTQRVSITPKSNPDLFIDLDNKNVADTFAVNDNAGGVICKYLYARGGESYSVGKQVVSTFAKGKTSDTLIHQIDQTYLNNETGVRALLIVNDGNNVDTLNVSRQFIRSSSDFTKSDPLKWIPIRTTGILDKKDLRSALTIKTTQPIDSMWQYDTKKMRIFKWGSVSATTPKSNSWLEYSDSIAAAFTFEPGSLVWIKTKGERAIDFGKGVTSSLRTATAINIPAKNFTDFALPYKFRIRIGDILDSTLAKDANADSLQFFVWSDTGKGKNLFKTLPFYLKYLPAKNVLSDSLNSADLKGYSVYNPTDKDIVLRIPPIVETMSHYGGLAKKKMDDSWAIKILAHLSDSTDLSPTYCAFNKEIKDSVTYYPLSPTFLQTYMGVFNDASKTLYGHAICGLLRDGGCAFKIAFVNNSDVSQSIQYKIATEGNLPAYAVAKVYNETSGQFEDSDLSITLASGARDYRWLFVGTSGYLAKVPVPLNTHRLKFIGVYPNPVRALARIRYSLPNTGVDNVKFTMYNIAGKLVWQKVVLSQGKVGNSELTLDARVQTRSLAAGLYVIKMSARTVAGKQIGVFEKKVTFIP